MRRVLALLGFGTLAACLPVSSPEGTSTGNGQGGTTGSSYYSPDAYGLPPFRDSGQNNYGTDAYGTPPFREDAGPSRGPPDVRDAGDPD